MTKLPERSASVTARWSAFRSTPMAPRLRSVMTAAFTISGGGEHSPATSVSLEAVAYRLSETGGTCRLLSLLTTTVLVIRIGLKRRQDLLVPIGEAYVLYNKMLAVLLCQAIGHPEPERQRAVIGYAGHAQLAACGLVTAAQHEELVAARISPVRKPFCVTLVAIDLKVILTAPQLLRSKAQPQPSRISISQNIPQAILQVGDAPSLMVKLLGRRSSDKSAELLLSACNQALKRLAMQLLRLTGRRHPSFQGHPDGVEHPCGYAVPADVVRLQGRRGASVVYVCEQTSLQDAEQLGIGGQGVFVALDACLVGEGQITFTDELACHGTIVPERSTSLSLIPIPTNIIQNILCRQLSRTHQISPRRTTSLPLAGTWSASASIPRQVATAAPNRLHPELPAPDRAYGLRYNPPLPHGTARFVTCPCASRTNPLRGTMSRVRRLQFSWLEYDFCYTIKQVLLTGITLRLRDVGSGRLLLG